MEEKKEKKIKYLIIKNGVIHKAHKWSNEFRGNSQDYPRALQYNWWWYKIYDYDKLKAMPLVRMLLEDFEPPKDITLYIVLWLCVIILGIVWLNYNWQNKINNNISGISSLMASVNGSMRDNILKNQEKINTWVIEPVIQNTELTEEQKKIKNENEILKQNNMALQLEAEKARLLANQPRVDELAYYNNIKEDFLKNEKEKMKKEVEAEYILSEKKILIEDEKNKIRAELREEFEKKYKKIILQNCKK